MGFFSIALSWSATFGPTTVPCKLCGDPRPGCDQESGNAGKFELVNGSAHTDDDYGSERVDTVVRVAKNAGTPPSGDSRLYDRT